MSLYSGNLHLNPVIVVCSQTDICFLSGKFKMTCYSSYLDFCPCQGHLQPLICVHYQVKGLMLLASMHLLLGLLFPHLSLHNCSTSMVY